MDRDSIISWAVLIIVAVLALNYLHFDCNQPEKSSGVKGFMDVNKPGSYGTQAGDAPRSTSADPVFPDKAGESGDSGDPAPGTPVPPPVPPSPGGPPIP